MEASDRFDEAPSLENARLLSQESMYAKRLLKAYRGNKKKIVIDDPPDMIFNTENHVIGYSGSLEP